jgi:RNA polymerase sigma-70 factor (ECF subfamily)
MQRASLEQLFESFRTTGDADALGAVFDATAPKLLLLAAHLTGDGGAAEDVVQATFLRAMQSAAEFDARRPLWPWLVGILANAAKMERRRRGRRVDPERVAAAPAPNDPSATAAAEETVEQVARAIETMPEPFRAVLALRLVHGLSHPQIARALGIPVATARTRLHRGLAQLREALPAGLAAAVALCAGERGLAAVRGVVMERAGEGASTTLAATGAPLRAVWLPRVVVGSLASVMIIATTLAVAWTARSAAIADDTPASTRRVVASATAAAVDDSRAGVAREALPAESAATGWELRGHITGAGAAGARVVARAYRGDLGTELGEARADGKGAYRIDVGVLREWSTLQRASAGMRIDVSADGAKPAIALFKGRLPLSAEGPQVFEIDAQLEPRGFSVTGRVVDAAGRPVADARVSLRRGTPASSTTITAETHPDGRWEIWPDVAAEYTLQAISARAGFTSRDVRWAADSSLQLGDLTLATAGVLEGRLAMQDGTPVPGQWFDLQRENERPIEALPRRRLRASTDDQGAFRVVVLEPGRYVLSVSDALSAEQQFAVETGHAPYELALEGQLITVQVREASGEPLPGVSLTTFAWNVDRAPGGDLIERAVAGGPSLSELGGRVSSIGTVQDAEATSSFLASWGSMWLFSASLRGGVPSEALWTAQPGIASARVELTLRAVEAGGWLAPEVVDEVGVAVEDYEVQVSMAVSGHVIAGWRRARIEAHQVEPLAPGRYRLTVKSGRRIANVWQNEAVETWADVRAGETTPVRIEVRRGGFVRLSLIGAAPRATEWRGVHFEEPGVRRHIGHAVEHPDGGSSWFSEGTVSVGTPLLLDKPFAAGMHTLRVYAEGYRPSTVDVRVEPGEITDVDVVMTPE